MRPQNVRLSGEICVPKGTHTEQDLQAANIRFGRLSEEVLDVEKMIVGGPMNAVARGFFWVLCVVVVTGALIPQDTLTTTVALSDKIVHTGAFLVLSTLGLWGYPSHRVTVIVSLVALGGAIEIAQGFTTTRSHEWLDFLADCLGVLLGCITVFAIKGREQ